MTKLTDEYLKEVLDYLAQSDAGSVKELRRHIDAIASELSQARERIGRLEVLAQDRLDATREMERERDEARAELAALRAAVPADGWKLVPVEPTNEMLKAGVAAAVAQHDERPWCPPCYQAMLAAAPKPPAQAVAVRVKELVFPAPGSRIPCGHETPWGTYTISKAAQRRYSWDLRYPPQPDDEYPTAEEAMRAAREHYRDAILSAIDARPEAAVKAEALREMRALFNKLATHAANGAAILCEHHADLFDPPGAF